MTADIVLDKTDIAILNTLQEDVPLVSRPWSEIAGKVGLPEHKLLDRMKRLKDAGILKGISPILDSREWGLSAATLVALHLPPGRVKEIACIISSYPEVSHNFRRDHYYSLWFTLSGRDKEAIKRLLLEILQRTGVAEEDVLNLPTVKKLKIDVRFAFDQEEVREGIIGPG
ncbi:MAG: AsnC family transcriptional regulator [Methanolinea sp.]|nr:AsnC family transcriptional regulator [Methanolinea sp.]